MLSAWHDTILDFRSEYFGKGYYGGNFLMMSSKYPAQYYGFLGSENVVSLINYDSLTFETPACIAAPLVNMVAKNAIRLGMAGQGMEANPMRIYAPKQITLIAQRILMGKVKLLATPENGILDCNKLVLLRTSEADDSFFEVVKSWLIKDSTEIEVIRPTV